MEFIQSIFTVVIVVVVFTILGFSVGECLKIHLGAEFTTVVKRYENLGYQVQDCCLTEAWYPVAPKKMLWAPNCFVAAPNTSHVGRLTF